MRFYLFKIINSVLLFYDDLVVLMRAVDKQRSSDRSYKILTNHPDRKLIGRNPNLDFFSQRLK